MAKSRLVIVLKENLLLLLTLGGVLLGVAVGFAVRTGKPSADALMWLGLPGSMYLRLLMMMIVPLIVASIISGAAQLDPKVNGKISLVAFVFIFVTNMIGALLGVAAYLIFKPGVGGSEYERNMPETQQIETQDIFADLIRNIIPDNLFSATFSQVQTAYRDDVDSSTVINISTLVNNSWVNTTETRATRVRYIRQINGPNILGLIFACTFIGIGAASLKKKGRILIELADAATNTVIVVLRWFLWTTPIGVFSLILVAVAGISDISQVFEHLAVFILAITSALVAQQLVIMPLILFLITRRNPYRHLLAISRPWLIGFSAASTAVALVEMLISCENKLGVDKRVSRFVVPFSVALSANGSAVFIAGSCLFIANLTGHSVSWGVVCTIGLLATISSLAIPSTPSSSIVTIIMILSSLNIPLEAIALLLAVDFFLDRLRTTSSVVSHTMCSVVTYHLCRDGLTGELTSDLEVETELLSISSKNPRTGQSNGNV